MLQDRVEVVRRALTAFVARISVNSAPCAVFAVPSETNCAVGGSA